MDKRGGCLIARYGGGGGSGYDASKVGRIMLRFRPIAPKPATGSGSGSGSGSSGSSPEASEATCRTRRGQRRKYIRKRKASSSSSEKRVAAAVTLPLLQEMPEGKVFPARGCREVDQLVKPENLPTWLGFGEYDSNNNSEYKDYGPVASPARFGVVDRGKRAVEESCVTLECVTDTWGIGAGDVEGVSVLLGRTDEERVMNLGRDACPGFICDPFGRVTWTNEAYRKMVCDGEQGQVLVWLEKEERVPVMGMLASCHRAFTCRVRVDYGSSCSNRKEMIRRSVTVPCDVCRMDGGGFAWRLDVKAALRLGR